MSQPRCRATRVFVADSSAISGQLLAQAIGKYPDLEVLGYSSNPNGLVDIVRGASIDVLLLSARIGEDIDSGLQILPEIRRQDPNLKIVLLLDSNKREFVVQSFRLGASGIFCRNAELHLLSKCIQAVHNGEIWANAQELQFLVDALSASVSWQLESRGAATLSKREKEVVRYLVEGLTNREIAQILTISQHTVKNYIFKIFDKLGVSNRVELAFHFLSRPRQFDSFNICDESRGFPKNAGQQLT